MAFSFTTEQEELRQTVRRFLEDRSTSSAIRRQIEGREHDHGLWAAVSRDLGLCGVHIPEQYGGQGLGFVELGIVAEEMGRALLVAPYFASVVLAASAIMNAADSICAPQRPVAPGRASNSWLPRAPRSAPAAA